jgi:hypothetical protein
MSVVISGWLKLTRRVGDAVMRRVLLQNPRVPVLSPPTGCDRTQGKQTLDCQCRVLNLTEQLLDSATTFDWSAGLQH